MLTQRKERIPKLRKEEILELIKVPWKRSRTFTLVKLSFTSLHQISSKKIALFTETASQVSQ